MGLRMKFDSATGRRYADLSTPKEDLREIAQLEHSKDTIRIDGDDFDHVGYLHKKRRAYHALRKRHLVAKESERYSDVMHARSLAKKLPFERREYDIARQDVFQYFKGGAACCSAYHKKSSGEYIKPTSFVNDYGMIQPGRYVRKDQADHLLIVGKRLF